MSCPRCNSILFPDIDGQSEVCIHGHRFYYPLPPEPNEVDCRALSKEDTHKKRGAKQKHKDPKHVKKAIGSLEYYYRKKAERLAREAA
jgi:DNA-directed RNA polymerase subunit M/transcription elongation factor TFIIS